MQIDLTRATHARDMSMAPFTSRMRTFVCLSISHPKMQNNTKSTRKTNTSLITSSEEIAADLMSLIPESQATDGTSTGLPHRRRYSCISCRRRKLRCDRQEYGCGLCARLGISCSYPERKRAKRTKDSDVKRLALRICEVNVRKLYEVAVSMLMHNPIMQHKSKIASAT